ncbi:MAG: class I SAM-dependent methyltransferase [Phycisphaerae bacterium]
MSVRAAPERCPACGGEPRERFALAEGVPLLQCRRCLLGWWRWGEFDPRKFYDRQYFQSADVSRGYDDYASLEAGVRRTARGRLRRVANLLARTAKPERITAPRRLYEIGCGTGVFLDEARNAGWDVRGVEVSDYGVERARARGLAVERGEAEALSRTARANGEQAQVDCVAMWDVIEHVRDPAGVIRHVAGRLRAGGILALSTGDVSSLCARLSGPRWHLFNLPEHLFFFSPDSLRRLLRAAGCRVIEVTREVNWSPLTYLVERLGKRVSPLRALTRHSRLARVVLPATLLDVIGVYAVREGVECGSRGMT